MADAAREAILPHFRSAGGLAADNKLAAGFDPVTVADRAAETAMRDVLADLRPDDGILGEEHGTVHGTSGLTWVLDPIDGTRSFISGTPTWGVLIALSDDTGPVMGMIDQPYVGERFMGGLNRCQWVGPGRKDPLRTKSTTELSKAILFSTFPEIGTDAQRAAFQRVSPHVQLTRYGCDCYAYALLAAGQIDLVIEAGLNAYDIQAPIAVIEAAGGVVTQWDGSPAHDGGTALAAATPELHAAAMALLNG
ncbi:MAG: histidinol-phosphatase [Marivita sp. XM-24bin2]|nr:MAG: histidinol-phosphatase [Marivita sp. XM-24bin2]